MRIMTRIGSLVITTSALRIGKIARTSRTDMATRRKAPEDARSYQNNSNPGTPGTNPIWDKAQGNRGKQLNPNQRSGKT